MNTGKKDSTIDRAPEICESVCVRPLGSDEGQKCCEDCVPSLSFEARSASTCFVIHVTRTLHMHVHYSCLEVVFFFSWNCFGIKGRTITHINVYFIIMHFSFLLSTHTFLGKHGWVYGDRFPLTVKPSQPDKRA